MNLAKHYFRLSVSNRRQEKMLLIQEWLPGFLDDLERNEITAGNYTAIRQLTAIQAELLRSKELGFKVEMQARGRSSRAHYRISWIPRDDPDMTEQKTLEEIDQVISERKGSQHGI